MYFELKCSLTFNKDLTGIDFDEILGKTKGLLSKGTPDGKGSIITDSRVHGRTLSLTISSGRYVRPHDAVFRLKNFLAKELGKEHHIGVKDIVGDSYKITFTTGKPRDLKIPFVKEVSFKGQSCTLLLEDLSEEFLKKNYVDRIVTLVREKTEKKQAREHHKVMYAGKKKKISFKEDPSQEMLKRNWIKRTPQRNQFIFGPQITELSEAVKRIMVDVVYEPLGFVEMMFPKIVNWSTWKKSGHVLGLYYGGFNPYFFSTPKTADPAYWEEVTDLIKITGEIPKEEIAKRLKAPEGGLSFAQCPPFWPYLEGECISEDSLPIKVFDWSGPTYRYEAGGAHGFERVDELHRIETLWVGTREQVAQITEKLRKKLRFVMEDVMELNMREAWVTPWFMEQKGMVSDDEPEIGTVDFEAILPYNDKWLEVQNCSNNGDSYPKSFNVKSQKDELCSGCAGGSFERYLSAFLAQKGFDPDDWPKKFRDYIKKIPEEIKFL